MAKVYEDILCINTAMVLEGQAIAHQQYLSAYPELREKLLDAEARARRIRSWMQPNPMMSWD